MLVHVFGAKCVGIEATKVTVEVDINLGIGIHLCGLGDAAVKESILRTTAALQTLGFHIPGKKIVINLAPADLLKHGSGYDVPIAVGIIAASDQRCLSGLGRHLIMGELGLDGSVRPIPGGLPIAEMALAEGFSGCILPYESAMEATQLENIAIFGVRNLNDVIRVLEGVQDCSDLLVESPVRRDDAPSPEVDFSDIIGQEGAKRGCEIACAGGHNLALVGSPGSGKSSLAKAMAGILPPMTIDEALLTSKIYSISGKGILKDGLMRTRPFRSPHCSASLAALIGGGGGDNVHPGEVSLAQSGILFIDEFALMPKSSIEALRGPLEDRKVTISRLKQKVTYPASFMLVAASNPCPCGYWGDGDRCTCTPAQRQNYLSRLSGPIMDRIDLQVVANSVSPSAIVGSKKAKRGAARVETSADVAKRVAAARERQLLRFKDESITCNAEMNNRQIERYCPLDEECRQTLESLLERQGFSMRAYFRIIKVARTIADLEYGADGLDEGIKPRHIMEAAQYRFLDRKP